MVSPVTEQEVCQMTQKTYNGLRFYVCQSCGWRWNCFEVRECPKCGKNNLDDRTKWYSCPRKTEIKTATGELTRQTTTQTNTQNTSESEKPKFSFSNQTNHDSLWAGSSAWHERLTCTQEDAGSNPARSTVADETSQRASMRARIPKRGWSSSQDGK